MSKVRYLVSGVADRNGRILLLQESDIVPDYRHPHDGHVEAVYDLGSYGIIPTTAGGIVDCPAEARREADKLIAKKMDQAKRRVQKLDAIKGIRVWDYRAGEEVAK